jgi:PPK2 family polyphosphate:nucleotide phosphotransferase
MWRTTKELPERGRIGIFNRSYYEEVLVVRVHPEILGRQRIPAHLVTRRLWAERYEDINALERYLSRNGTLIRKFFLHLSKEEQRRRFLERLDDPAKNWKFRAGDLADRKLWPKFQKAYEDAIVETSTSYAPWYVVPADHNWARNLAVARILLQTMKEMNPQFPPPDPSIKDVKIV